MSAASPRLMRPSVPPSTGERIASARPEAAACQCPSIRQVAGVGSKKFVNSGDCANCEAGGVDIGDLGRLGSEDRPTDYGQSPRRPDVTAGTGQRDTSGYVWHAACRSSP
ncbi:MAG TPA: hypothetical protein PLW24_06810 [Burkholderiaceae bacterium]|nr:hypothetical protein [Burkholderiaceae bacterium]